MFIDKVIIRYDQDYNFKLIELIKETIEWATQNSKNPIRINKDEIISNQLDTIGKSISMSPTLSEFSKTLDVSGMFKVLNRIESKLKLLDPSIELIPGGVFTTSLLSCMTRTKALEKDFDKIWNRYKSYQPNASCENFATAEISLERYLKQREMKKDTSFNILNSFNKFIKETVDKIRYLGPLREMPKSMYSWNIDVDPEYVGAKGEYFPSVLSTLENKIIETILPGNNEIEKYPFYEALHCWCQYLKVASEIHVKSEYSFGMNITIHNIHDIKSDIMNVGVGTSQVLPVLIMGLISSRNSLIVYEQPELHLHPYSQSRLADFFIAMSKLGKQVIVETHSEYMLHRFRYHLLKGTLQESNIKVNFFANKRLGNNGL